MIPLVRTSRPNLALDTALLKPGTRLAVGLSGGADSVALLFALYERRAELGLVLHAAHLNHGLRGAEADGDLEFCRALAGRLGLAFHEARVDVAASARRSSRPGEEPDHSPADSIENTARNLRYAWFRRLLAEVPLDLVATAHTLDDQAETVAGKFLRGAWTEGIAGIHPLLTFPEGSIIRPMLHVRRAEIGDFLLSRNQAWREDSSNLDLKFTRNRIRHQLLPLLDQWNPQLRQHLAQMAELARDEEAWWAAEISRIAPEVILRGRPVRGGGRASTSADGIALDLRAFSLQPAAVQRRLLRHAAARLEASLDFAATEKLRQVAGGARAGRKIELGQGLHAERTHRELRLIRGPVLTVTGRLEKNEQYECVIPGVTEAAAFGCRVHLEVNPEVLPAQKNEVSGWKAVLRFWRAGDRVHLRHSSGPRKVKEVLERMKVSGNERSVWPVLEIDGRIAWMRGVEVEPDPCVRVVVELPGQDAGHGEGN